MRESLVTGACDSLDRATNVPNARSSRTRRTSLSPCLGQVTRRLSFRQHADRRCEGGARVRERDRAGSRKIYGDEPKLREIRVRATRRTRLLLDPRVLPQPIPAPAAPA